jgi:hypothetical protein
MPNLTRKRLQGIKLTMNFREHNPPHFHASYNGEEVAMLLNGTILAGSLPQAQLKLVSEWAQPNGAGSALGAGEFRPQFHHDRLDPFP